ncbi:MAG: hypothetical protein H7A47_01830 [Verrucomicrobiales bacterium]|nr:hypothetical protein [Verrucomicrobiales bacterium]
MNERVRTALLLAAGLLAVFLQVAWDLPRRLLATPLNLLPALMVVAALIRPPGAWRMLAVVGGLAQDAFSANRLGVSVVPLYLVGWVMFAWRELLLRELAFAQFILGAAASAVVPLLTLGTLMSLGETPLLGWRQAWQWLAGAVVGGVLTPLLFQALSRLDAGFSHPTVSPAAFRTDREILRGRY